ncbi:MAG: hypothetical protein NZ742_01865 [Acidobacteria bacterium]|nr:hypothetical protein [Acidobacteriota bacterium]MDW7983085.1 hypothetical protein [Acidobacteriota bacterium]
MKSYPDCQKLRNRPRWVPLGSGLLLAWLSMGCGVAPWMWVRSRDLAPTDWDRIEQRVLNLTPDRPGRALHVVVWSQKDRIFLRMYTPLWMVRLPVDGSRTLVRWFPPDGCDEVCQAVLTSRAWKALLTRGTSIWVSTPTERVALWIE